MRPIIKPDTTNTNPEYWERILKSHGLGVIELIHEGPDIIESEELDSDEENEEPHLENEESEE